MATWLGTYGTEAFGGGNLPRPGAIIMQYTGLSEYSEPDPSTYACVADRDGIVNRRVMQTRLDIMQQLDIDTEFHVYSGLGHGFGLGTGTSAEGRPDDAKAFWKKQMLFSFSFTFNLFRAASTCSRLIIHILSEYRFPSQTFPYHL